MLKRIDLTSRSLVALVEPGSCFAGDARGNPVCRRSLLYGRKGNFEGDNRPAATVTLTEGNFGPYPMSNDLTRLQTRFLGEPEKVGDSQGEAGEPLEARSRQRARPRHLRLRRYRLGGRGAHFPGGARQLLARRDDRPWRPICASPGPETMETRIFGRLTAWQNWIFQRPNAVGEDGALKRYGTGRRGEFDMRRV